MNVVCYATHATQDSTGCSWHTPVYLATVGCCQQLVTVAVAVVTERGAHLVSQHLPYLRARQRRRFEGLPTPIPACAANDPPAYFSLRVKLRLWHCAPYCCAHYR